MLSQIGLDFDIIVPDCDEKTDITDPEDMVKMLSDIKCTNVSERLCSGHEDTEKIGAIVIGSDTIVVHEGRVLGKPVDEDDAFKMLKKLQGDKHTVYTAVTLIDTLENKKTTFCEHTDVYMYPQTDEALYDYIKSGEPMDKAGAYGVQGRGAVLVKAIDGDFYTVVGLPIARLSRELQSFLD